MQFLLCGNIGSWHSICLERVACLDDTDPIGSSLRVSCFLGNLGSLNFMFCGEICKGIPFDILHIEFYYKDLSTQFVSIENCYRF